MTSNLAEKYRPKRSNDLFPCHSEAINTIKGFLQRMRDDSILGIYGPTGIGKNTILQVLAEECGGVQLEIIPHLAHLDVCLKQQKKTDLMSILGFSAHRKIIVLDDPYTVKDNKVIREITNQYHQTNGRPPLVIICDSHVYFSRIKGITSVDIKIPPLNQIMAKLGHLIHVEKIKISLHDFRFIAKMSRGDIRSLFIFLEGIQKTTSYTAGANRTKDETPRDPRVIAADLLHGKKIKNENELCDASVIPILHKTYLHKLYVQKKRDVDQIERMAVLAETFSMANLLSPIGYAAELTCRKFNLYRP